MCPRRLATVQGLAVGSHQHLLFMAKLCVTAQLQHAQDAGVCESVLREVFLG